MSGASCETYRDRLPDWVSGRLAEDDARIVARHVAECAHCAAEAGLVRALAGGRPAPPEGLARRISEAVRSDLPAQAAGGAVRPRRGASPRRLRPAWALAAAAGLVLVAGTAVLREGRFQGAPGALGEVAVDEGSEVWIASDGMVAGAPLLDDLSDEDLASLLEEMGG